MVLLLGLAAYSAYGALLVLVARYVWPRTLQAPPPVRILLRSAILTCLCSPTMGAGTLLPLPLAALIIWCGNYGSFTTDDRIWVPTTFSIVTLWQIVRERWRRSRAL